MLPKMLIVVLSVPLFCLAEAHFDYGGIDLRTDLASLRQRYPSSIVNRDSIRLSATDSHDGMYYVQKRMIDGQDEIRIVFERPSEQLQKQPQSWEEDRFARFPKCEGILRRLTEQYMQPIKERSWVEERLNHQIRTWSNATESLSLDCSTVASGSLWPWS